MSTEVENIVSSLPISTANDVDDDSSCGNHSEEGGLNFSDSEPKDSGIDCSGTDQTLDMPDEETCEAIMKTVEYYLSDANILKDPFLLKHVRRNKEGFVSLKLLASFRKVRSLSRNWKAVAHSVQKSSLLAMNYDGTKVRRLAPLPDYDETVNSRSIIVSGFSSDKPSVDSISEMFTKCGDIALVRILRPGGSIPSDVKRFLLKNPDIQSKVSALVEFEEHAAAKKALECILPEGIKVVHVAFKDKVNQEAPNSPSASPTDSPSKDSPKKKKKNRKSSNTDKKTVDAVKNSMTNDKLRNKRSGSVSSQSSGYLSSSPSSNNSFFENRFPRRHSHNPSSIYNDPNSSFASLSNRHRHGGSRDLLQRSEVDVSSSSSATLSPWRRRRAQLIQSDSNLASSMSSAGQSLQGLPVKTIRLPKGPDGTNGFCPRMRSRLPSTAE